VSGSEGRLRVAVIGVAGIGRTHLQAYRSLSAADPHLCSIVAVCDVSEESRERARAEFGAGKAYGDYRSLLDDPEVDLVSLCVPHFFHRSLALAVIASGKHLLVEKPVGMTHGEAMEIAAAAERGAGTAGAIFQSRFDPRARFVQAQVMPRLGRVRFASSREYHWRGARYYAGGAWRGTWWGEGGGLFINQCIHGWDLFQWLLGGVDHAYGYWANLLHPSIEVEDIGYGFIQFHGRDGQGASAKTVATTCLSGPPVTEATPWPRRLSMHIIAEHGEVTANDFRAPRQGLPLADFRSHDERLDRELHEAMEEAAQSAPGDGPDHATNIRVHLQAVRSGQPPPVTVESAAEVQKIIDGIHWHGWRHADAFRAWAAAATPLPVDADAARAHGWDGGALWEQLLAIVEEEGPGLRAPFLEA
jgi:predicted dehydrogenase